MRIVFIILFLNIKQFFVFTSSSILLRERRRLLVCFIFIFCLNNSFAQTKKKTESTAEIEWMSFSEAVKRSKKEPKKILVDVYTEWCSWCKVMDKTTYTDPHVVKYITKYFYAVKFDAETKDTILFDGHTFVSSDVKNKKSPHTLATAMLTNKMAYPTTVFLDEKFAMLGPIPGYLKVENIEPILMFYGENAYKTMNWDEFYEAYVLTWNK